MRGVTGTKTVLRRTKTNDFLPAFHGPAGGREYTLQMDANVWNDMDRPEVITVTIERFDTLNGDQDE